MSQTDRPNDTQPNDTQPNDRPRHDTVQPRADRPNVVLIMVDDMGFSDLGCYGSELRTPTLDRLGADGVRMTQFYNTARCSPARASLLTGLHPHQTGVGILTNDDGPLGYPGTINDRCVTVAEVLGGAGWTTAMTGKWHLAGSIEEPNDAWPTRRGFQHFFGILSGASSYYQPVSLRRGEQPVTEVSDDFYLTTVLGEEASRFVADHCATPAYAQGKDPFLLYLPFTAPHWPLHAPSAAVERWRGAFDAGWDELRRQRRDRQVDSGLIDPGHPLTERDAEVTPWDETAELGVAGQPDGGLRGPAGADGRRGGSGGLRAGGCRCAGTTRLIMFLSDNGGCAEEMEPAWVDELDPKPYHTPAQTADGRRVRRGNDTSVQPGGPDTFASYGKPWANLSNTPFREYKHWVHEGGIATPFIAHWPDGGLQPGWDRDPHQLPDVLATVLDATGVAYPTSHPGRDLLPPEGTSMLGSWRGTPTPEHPLFFEHEGNCALRTGRWKLVRKHAQDWELYDLEADRTERDDLAAAQPDRVRAMAAQWQDWGERCGVKPRGPMVAAGVAHDTMEYVSSHRATA